MPTSAVLREHYNTLVPSNAPGVVRYRNFKLIEVDRAASDANSFSVFNSITSDLAELNSAEAIPQDRVYRVKSINVRCDVIGGVTLDENLFTYLGEIYVGYFDVPAAQQPVVFTFKCEQKSDFFTNVHSIVLHSEDIPPFVVPGGKCFGFVLNGKPEQATTIAVAGTLMFAVDIVYETSA